jgi:DNA-binding FadR family transcriptional regulator
MDKAPFLKPLKSSRSLAAEIVARISGEIESGRLVAGSKLPTEQEMAAAMGVSRTVVREAVAALKAEGLVITRQGLGAYVAAQTSRPFRIEMPDGVSIEDVINIMELRAAIEVEAAALAADRASRAQLQALSGHLEAIDAAIEKGEGAIAEDFALHQAIAAASGNPQFAGFLNFLGQHVIPRQSVRVAQQSPQDQRAYLETIQAEHRRIVEALQRRDAAEARAAMRAHLDKALGRYRKLSSAGRR